MVRANSLSTSDRSSPMIRTVIQTATHGRPPSTRARGRQRTVKLVFGLRDQLAGTSANSLKWLNNRGLREVGTAADVSGPARGWGRDFDAHRGSELTPETIHAPSADLGS